MPADIILITHSHYDHCSIEDIDKPDTVIVTKAESAKKTFRRCQSCKSRRQNKCLRNQYQSGRSLQYQQGFSSKNQWMVRLHYNY